MKKVMLSIIGAIALVIGSGLSATPVLADAVWAGTSSYQAFPAGIYLYEPEGLTYPDDATEDARHWTYQVIRHDQDGAESVIAEVSSGHQFVELQPGQYTLVLVLGTDAVVDTDIFSAQGRAAVPAEADTTVRPVILSLKMVKKPTSKKKGKAIVAVSAAGVTKARSVISHRTGKKKKIFAVANGNNVVVLPKLKRGTWKLYVQVVGAEDSEIIKFKVRK